MKKLLCMFLVALFSLCISVNAEIVDSGICGENVTWTLSDDGTLTITGKGDTYDYIDYVFYFDSLSGSGNDITSVLSGSAGDTFSEDGIVVWEKNYSSAWENPELITTVVIKKGVSGIGSDLFADCVNLERVEMADTVTFIGDYAFSNCKKIKEINFSSNISNVGREAFYNCISLEKVDFSNVVYTHISPFAFCWCENLESVSFGNGGVELLEDAFFVCEKLENVYFGDGELVINDSGFNNCVNLKVLEIAANRAQISGEAFRYCTGLEKIVVSSRNEDYSSDINGVLFNKDKTKIIFYPCGNKAQSYTIPDSVKIIGKNAFGGCEKLEKIIIPDGVIEIECDAFHGCRALEQIDLPDGLKIIGNGAFTFCEKITQVVVPDSVTELGATAFFGCFSLEKVKLPIRIEKIARSTFGECGKLSEISIPKNVKNIGDEAFGGCKSLAYVNIPDGVESIGEWAFTKTGLTSITFPESVRSVGSYAFFHCDQMKSFVILSRDFEFGQYVFNCEELLIYGYKGSSSEMLAKENGLYFVDIMEAYPTNANVTVDGKEVTVTGYNIGGNNYFKLRDFAALLNGSQKQFGVSWDEEKRAINLDTGNSYEFVGGELTVSDNSQTKTPIVNDAEIYKDGSLISVMAFNVDGNNYFKLRDVAKAFNFSAIWDYDTRTNVITTTEEYVPGK